ncbi:MAG: 3-hydroxyacyl-ACP dehydratase FabZ [Spirochaetaceae bacterium]
MSEITELLPHRSPFLFVDRIEQAAEDRIIGYKTFRADEHFFAGHFPDYPVVPGVILVESLAQCGGAGVKQLGRLGDALFFLATVERAKFRRQVRPNETVRMEIENLKVSARVLKQKGTAYVDGETAAEAEWLCLVGEPSV